MPAINPERLLGDLYTLRNIGTYKTGVHRPTLSPDDVASRQWLVDRMTEAGLDARIDGIGNVFGKSAPRAVRFWPARISKARIRPAGSTARSA